MRRAQMHAERTLNARDGQGHAEAQTPQASTAKLATCTHASGMLAQTETKHTRTCTHTLAYTRIYTHALERRTWDERAAARSYIH